MVCEVCGREVERTIKVLIEGTAVEACSSCSRFGKRIVATPKGPRYSSYQKKRPMYRLVKPRTDIVEDYHDRIRIARERSGLTQEELGKHINEKASVINRLEARHMPPDEKLAKKLEKVLDISLFEVIRDNKVEDHISFSDGLTLGDMIKKK